MVINLPPKGERKTDFSQAKAGMFRWDPTVSLIMDLMLKYFHTRVFLIVQQMDFQLFAKQFYFGACEEIGVTAIK